jgi:hypothetical protein
LSVFRFMASDYPFYIFGVFMNYVCNNNHLGFFNCTSSKIDTWLSDDFSCTVSVLLALYFLWFTIRENKTHKHGREPAKAHLLPY